MRKVVLALVASLFALLAVPALAADGTISATTPVYSWKGGPMNGVGNSAVPTGLGYIRCTPAYECDNENLEIKEAGSLTIVIKAGSGSNDLDLRLYKTDESFAAPGAGGAGTAGTPADSAPGATEVGEDITTEKDAKVTVKSIKPGFYVAQVAAFNATAGTYDGTATFTPAPSAAAPAPAPGATATPAPSTGGGTTPAAQQPKPASNNSAAAKKKKKAKAACNKKAKKIKNAKKRKAALKKCAKKYK
jgi:hypothetical protein